MTPKISAFVLLVMLVVSSVAQAAPVRRLYQDVYLPTQKVLERDLVVAPALSTGNLILSAHAGATSTAVATATSFSAQPDVARNVVITAGASAGGLSTCVVVVAGTNIFNASISENFSFASGTLSTQTGNKAFKTVTSVTWPANCETGGFGVTWNVGVGSKLGLKRCLGVAGDFFHATLNGVKEATAPTIAASSSAVESNTATLSSALAGTNVQLYYVQNYGCFP